MSGQVETRSDDVGISADWRPAVRVDIGRLRKAERTASGGVRVPGAVARTGILEYLRADGTKIRELVPPEEASRAESLRSLRDAVVTVGHPDGGARLVSPATYKADSVGHVSGDPRMEGEHVVADLAILESDAMRRVDRGELVEISSGYRVLIDPTPGEWQGERYDAVQRRREYNHVALLPSGGGRAGSTVALRLDGEEIDTAVQVRADHNEPRPVPPVERRDTVKTERIDGVDYEIGSTAWAQARAKFDAAQQRRIDELEEMGEEKAKTDAELEKMKTDRDELQKQVDELNAKIEELESPERTDAIVERRMKLFEGARRILGVEAKFVREDGKAMSDRDVMVKALSKAAPNLDCAEKSDDFVAARFDAALEQHATRPSAPLAIARQFAIASPVRQASGMHTAGRTPPRFGKKR